MGTLTINTNTSAINAHRNLLKSDRELTKTLEHLSSGLRVGRAADGPAVLMISEHIRAQIASVEQAIRNSETSVSMVQTTEASLSEVNQLLVGIRQLAIHAANEGANDQNMLEADQLEVSHSLQSIDRIANFAQFGTKKLLDGSNGVNGMTAGPNLSFIGATEDTKNSPDEGYEVHISQAATQATMLASAPLTQEIIDAGVELILQEKGRIARYTSTPGEDARVVMQRLQNNIDNAGLELDVDVVYAPNAVDGVASGLEARLKVTHREYGKEPSFVAISSVPGILSDDPKRPRVVENGTDIKGTINRQLAYGKGRELTATEGTDAHGLTVLYSGETPEDPAEPVGRVNVSQRSLIFQVGPDAGQRVSVSLDAMNTNLLGQNVENESNFKSLASVDVRSAQGAHDTILLADKAINDLNNVRAALGAVQKNALETNIRNLHVSFEELTNSESVLRDADMAKEITALTRNQIVTQSAMAMLGQANQSAKNVLGLLQ